MKKEYLPTILIIILLILFILYYYVFYDNKNNTKTININVVPTLITKLENNNSIWCASFQLIWNDLKNDIVKSDIILSNDENNQTVLDLNKETFTTNDISDKYYYKKHGLMTPNLKKEIEQEIQNKFDQKSDILNNLKFEQDTNKYLLYTMLYKKFEFMVPFDILNNKTFGIDDESKNELNNNVKILYYNDNKDYAVKLLTKDNDEIILVKGKNSKNNFQEIFNELKYEDKEFLDEDTISISNFDFKIETNFEELENKQIKNTDFDITKTIQIINFKLDNTGGKVKSESAIELTKNAVSEARHFDFTNQFTLFLKEKNKEKPYLAIKIDDIDKLI